jgi:hypothetical protein
MVERRRLVLAALVAAILTACGSGEPACDLLEDVPERADRTSIEQLQEVADAARESEVPEIRTIGRDLTESLARRQALEGLAPGLAVEVLQMHLDALRQACQRLADEG